MPITNKHNVPEYIAAFLLHDDYDYDSRKNTFSTTTIIKPLKQIIMGKRNEDHAIDIMDLVKARIGSAVHAALELVWTNPEYRRNALKRMGYDNDTINAIVVNPKDTVDEEAIPIFMEERMERKINGYRITGKNDFNGDGILRDTKTTSVFTYVYGSKKEDYRLQLSIYRWLRPNIVRNEVGYIDFLFTDWKKSQVDTNPKYPKHNYISQPIKLLSENEVHKYLAEKVRKLKKYMDKPEEEIPACTPEDLWQKETTYQYFSKPTNKRASKNFSNPEEAYTHLKKKGIGEIRVNKGKVMACNYCSGAEICNQRKQLIVDNLLDVVED